MNNLYFIFLLCVGLMQMTGDLLNLNVMRGIGMATCASPAPKVFSTTDGLETFSSQFFLSWKDAEGKLQQLQLTSELSNQIKGPYNRRNVYGALLSYGPALKNQTATKNMHCSMLNAGIREKQLLLKELGIDVHSIRDFFRIEVVPRNGTDATHLELADELNWYE